MRESSLFSAGQDEALLLAAARAAGFETQPLAPETVPGGTRYALVIFHRDGAHVALLSSQQPLVVGRAAPADIVLADASLSREHARFELRGDEVLVEDLASLNGTWLGGARIQSAVLRVGQRVSLGGVVLSLQLRPGADTNLLGIESHDGFCLALEEELARARQLQRCLALLMTRAECAHVSQFVERLRKHLRPVDRIGLYASGVLEVCMPEMTLPQASALAERLTAEVSGEPELFASVASFPESGQTLEKLVARCQAGLQPGVSRERIDITSPWGLEIGRDADATESDFVASSAAMRELSRQVDRLAQSTIPVLLLGETGTGKEVLARAIHERGARSQSPMVYVNCAAIPTQLVESTFFGHERGAFTGAVSQQKGAFEAARAGTLLLDEVGDLPLAAQAALLRVLETRRVARVGSSREFDVDVRVISATHRDLEQLCESGGFRWDLLYRLNVMSLTLPPLRDRLEELEVLITRFILRTNQANARQIRGVEPDALARLRAHDWPGNVRELRNVIERAVVVAESDRIRVDDLPQRFRSEARVAASGSSCVFELDGGTRAARGGALQGGAPDGGVPDGGVPDGGVLSAAQQRKKLSELEAEMLLAAVRAAGGNQTEAARRIGMPLRTLVRKLAALRLQGKG